MIKGFKVKNVYATTKIPSKGIYVELSYIYSDFDGCSSIVAGPLPESNKDLVCELLNLLEDMKARYPDGKGKYDGYDSIVNYAKWFDLNGEASESEDDKIRVSLGLKTEHTPNNSECISELVGYTVFYHGGITAERYEVEVY